MPAYDFKCKACGTTRTETFHIADTHTPPDCGGCQQPMRKVYGAAPVVFRGSGFYSTDHRRV